VNEAVSLHSARIFRNVKKQDLTLEMCALMRVIVGPHLDKEKRKLAVEILLVQNDIDADVLTSAIPYLG